MRLLSYYLQLLLPIGILVWLSEIHFPVLFVLGLLFYVLVYRTVVDYFRLTALGIFKEKSDFWKLFIPLFRSKYFYELYFRA
jgi:hypothetical protein